MAAKNQADPAMAGVSSMSRYPYLQLHLGESYTIAIAGAHIKVFNSKTGSLIASTTNFDDSEQDALLRSGPVRFSCPDEEFKYLVTVGDDKKLKVWQIEGLRILTERELPKKPTQIKLTRDGQTVIVSDKFGDVFSYPLHPSPSESNPGPRTTKSRDNLVSHENPSGGTLILGHVSVVTTLLLTPDEKYIITSDRDEHIRLSWYPEGYNIEMYCLGHKKFVSALHVPSFSPSTLISAGGDPVIKFWDWMTGSLQREIRVSEAVEPFIVIKGKKKNWTDDESGKGDRRKRKRTSGKSKRRGRGDNEVQMDVDMGNEGDVEGDSVADEDTVTVEDGIHNSKLESEHLILAIHKITSIDLRNGRYLIFDACGSTALFSCAYPSDDRPSFPEKIHSFDFHKPVLDFFVHDTLIWVLLDGEWENPISGAESPRDMVRVIKWVPESEQFSEIDSYHDYTPLITALNSHHPIYAKAEDLAALDLYADLTSLPKNTDSCRDPMKHDIEEQALFAAEVGKEMTTRELGRLKHKKALAAKLQGGDGNEGEERESKKIKSDDGSPASEDKMED